MPAAYAPPWTPSIPHICRDWRCVGRPRLVCREPQRHEDFEGKVYQVRNTHASNSSSRSTTEPNASPSLSNVMWCLGVLWWGQCSTDLNRACSFFSSSTLLSDTVGAVTSGHPGLCGPCFIPHAPLPPKHQVSGNFCSTPPAHHGPRCPGTPFHPPSAWSLSTRHCSLSPGHPGVWAHH